METRLKFALATCLIAATVVMTWLVASKVADTQREQAIRENYLKGRTLVQATFVYLTDHKNTYPDPTPWEEELRPYLPEGFTAALAGTPSHRFAMNSVFSKRKLAEPSEDVSTAVLFFESTATNPSANDELKSLPEMGDKVVIAYAGYKVEAQPIAWVAAIKDPFFHKRVLGKKSL